MPLARHAAIWVPIAIFSTVLTPKMVSAPAWRVALMVLLRFQKISPEPRKSTQQYAMVLASGCQARATRRAMALMPMTAKIGVLAPASGVPAVRCDKPITTMRPPRKLWTRTCLRWWKESLPTRTHRMDPGSGVFFSLGAEAGLVRLRVFCFPGFWQADVTEGAADGETKRRHNQRSDAHDNGCGVHRGGYGTFCDQWCERL